MNDWYYEALREIEKDFEDGLFTNKEYQQALKDLDREYDEEQSIHMDRDSY